VFGEIEEMYRMSPAPKLTIASLFESLRSQLLHARQQKNESELEKLFAAFILIGDAAIEADDEIVIELAENFERVTHDALVEGNWKSTIPSEKDLQRLLAHHN
jgi:hypothetical protein